jgi:hypothetical protein
MQVDDRHFFQQSSLDAVRLALCAHWLCKAIRSFTIVASLGVDQISFVVLIAWPLQVLTHAGLNEWDAKLYTSARRFWDQATLVRLDRPPAAAHELLYWTWANCEMSGSSLAASPGSVAKALKVIQCGLKCVNSRSLKLLATKVCLALNEHLQCQPALCSWLCPLTCSR